MKYPKTVSQIAEVVHADARSYVDLDTEPGMNPSGGTPHCGNKEALEDLFVSATANWFAAETKLPFQEVVYAPNRWIERDCGFDLSIAPVNSTRLRLRIQNKIEASWCDASNNISFHASRFEGTTERWTDENRLHHQVRLLCSMYPESKERAYPYLMVHQCFCLHEYRRMGRKVSEIYVPNLGDKLRTMAIDLTNPNFIAMCLEQTEWTLQLATDPEKQEATCNAVIPGEKSIPLEVRDLQYLLNQLGPDLS